MAIVSQLCISFPYVLHGLCEDYLTCDIAFNAVMPLSRASTRGRYSRIEGVTKVVHIIHPSRSMPFFRTPSNDRLWLPQAGIKSFNDLCIKSNSFCHLREEFYESPFLRCPVMESWQLTPRCFGTHAPYYLSVGLLPTKSNLIVCSSIPLDVFCVSTRDVSTSHSASWSCIARSSRRSIL